MEVLFSMGCLVISCFIVSLESPQWLISCLVIQTILVLLMIGLFTSIWFCYILFLVFLGGLLVMFIYVSSLMISLKLEYYSIFYKWGLIMSSVGLGSLYFQSEGLNYLFLEESISSEMFYLVKSMFSEWSGVTYLYIIIYLLFSLYCICLLVKVNQGPLRALS